MPRSSWISAACALHLRHAQTSGRHRAGPASGGRAGGQSSHVRGWSEKLAVVEVAIALALTVGAGLLVRSYSRLLNVDPGFDSRNVLATAIELPPTRYGTASSTIQFFEQLVARVRAIPGVMSAAAVTQLPLTVPGWAATSHRGARREPVRLSSIDR